jgi:DNA-binding transcriptional MerR regulator
MDRGKVEKKPEPAATAPGALPDRPFYKIGEVCEATDTQPYVLRFWETEFPQLAPRKSRTGQRIYEKKDIDLVLRIKKLLYEEEFTIAGARKKLEEEAAAAGLPPAAGPAAARRGAAKRGAARPAGGAAGADSRLAATLRSLRKELRALKGLLES